MIDQQTLTTLLAMLGGFVATAGYLHSIKRDLDTRIDRRFAEQDARFVGQDAKIDALAVHIHALRTELKTDISELRTELKGDIGDLRSDIKDVRSEIKDVRAGVRILEQRTFDMVHHGFPGSPATGTA